MFSIIISYFSNLLCAVISSIFEITDSDSIINPTPNMAVSITVFITPHFIGSIDFGVHNPIKKAIGSVTNKVQNPIRLELNSLPKQKCSIKR